MAACHKARTAATATGSSRSAMTAMVIGGRAARACDVCGKERARWYCAADSAYLCERCDGSVHSANAVAKRHERVRLGPDGTPTKATQAPAAITASKRDAAAADLSPAPAPPSTANFIPRKRPRSIRRHKPSSFHAFQHVRSSSSSNHSHIYGEPGSFLASSHGVMIDNPRNNPDFIPNISSSELLINKLVVVKSEPYSPADIGDQVKVPDQIEDDPLLESLFDFRDLEDDDLFLHQVPIYNPLQGQDLSPSLTSTAEESEEAEDKKPIIDAVKPSFITNGRSGDDDRCTHTGSPHGLSQVDYTVKCLPSQISAAGSDQSPSLAESNEAEDSTGNNISDLDQLDFGCVLDGSEDHEEYGDNMQNLDASCVLDMDMQSNDCMDICTCGAGRDENRGLANAGYIEHHHSNCNIRDDAKAGQYDGDHHADGYVSGFDFDATGKESPRTWLCKVKTESLPELGFDLQGTDVCVNDASLRDKLICKGSLSGGSPSCFKLGLKLNFEDVFSSWSDRGSFWIDGQRPPEIDSCLDFLGGCFVPDVLTSGSGPEGEGQQHLVPILNHKTNKRSDGSAREASVLRYREKRRTRLFSKKIRYEVRKLNAEKRPRMKGRFVKRIDT